MNRAVYPGSFDPITNGHIDVIERVAGMVEHVTVAILINAKKQGLFSLEERKELILDAVKHLDNVEVICFSGLLADYCRDNHIDVIVRGLRAVSDYEYEIQMAQMNRKLYPEAETIFLMTNPIYAYLSSSLVKEVAGFGGCVSDLIPKLAYQKLIEKLHDEREDV